VRRHLPAAIAAFLFSIPAAFAQTPDANTLIRESIQNYDKAWRAGMRWSYMQTDVTCSGGVKEVDVSSVIPLEGTPYERLITKNGHALSAEEQRKEDEKYDKELHKRQSESAEARAARISKYEKERAFLVDIPNAYNFKVVGQDTVNGRAAWVVELLPKPGFEPTTAHGALLKHIEGKLWIDQKDLQWAKAEATVIGTISIGLILARIGEGAHITLELSRVTDGLWMPKEITINGTARVLLVHNKNLDEQLTFSHYHLQSGAGTGPQLAAR